MMTDNRWWWQMTDDDPTLRSLSILWSPSWFEVLILILLIFQFLIRISGPHLEFDPDRDLETDPDLRFWSFSQSEVLILTRMQIWGHDPHLAAHPNPVPDLRTWSWSCYEALILSLPLILILMLIWGLYPDSYPFPDRMSWSKILIWGADLDPYQRCLSWYWSWSEVLFLIHLMILVHDPVPALVLVQILILIQILI